MKDMNLKVKYMRTDTGCFQVFIYKGNKLLSNVIVFPDETVWFEMGRDNKSPAYIHPEEALHRVWYKEVCSTCGWESEPYEGQPIGLGGTLNFPECVKTKRGLGIEGCYGNVIGVELDWETKQPKM